ncbi:E3 ubiquitin- ligase DZIP3 [Paramuricea clavata]|uniref:E3 ubiquitin- ligase DZIP3 n=1 Tax=Paramuricea clavata TaxID=317549 RepID=A0A6S7J015_PARCT|nr:E3 ubiquitin- ligase DZIP3 [Paramuricea clavata]
MCDNVDGFRDKLSEVLRREHSRDAQTDAFRVLLNVPLHAIETRKPRWCMMPWRKAQHKAMLIIVDALDESQTDTKSEFLELISEKFPQLPEWIKIFITSRPELQVRNKLQHLNPMEIRSDGPHHNLDLKHFIPQCLPDLSEGNVNFFISKCEGSFLYAYYLVNEIKEMDLGIEPNLSDVAPKGISWFYEKQFKSLRTGLQRFNSDTWSSILKSFVNVIAASRAPLPMKILVECMGMSSEKFEVREKIIQIMSEVLPVYEGCLTVYHKSLWDWLILDEYDEHAFVANVAGGKKLLTSACKSIYSDITSLGSVSDFQMSSETRYALNGENLLLDVGDTEDFHWLVNVRVNYLKYKVPGLNIDVAHVLRICKSNLSDPSFWAIIQLHAILRNFPHFYSPERMKKCYIYLQSFANRDYDVLQMNNNDKNEARNILDKRKEAWLEKVRHECNSKLKVISHAVFNIDKLSSGHLKFTALSRENKLLACAGRRNEVFTLPRLTIFFQIELSNRRSPEFLIFSPDSSYLLFDSVRTCISIRDQKEVLFIPHGPRRFDCCSFSSCGMKLVTLEKDFIKLWDVRTKVLLVEVDNVIKAKYCCFSKCNSYILTAGWMPFSPDKSTLFDSKTLASLKAGEICGDTCLTYQENYQMISPSHVECRALSPDNSYIACCYENSVFTVRSVNNGETLQTVVLKQLPVACWWSELYLWVVCNGVVVKYPYDSTQRKVLGNELEEYTINFDVVLIFANDFLVIRYDEKISILKYCKEKLCPQHISDLHSFLDSATISSDGCAVLLYGKYNSNYQLW